jgi:hypothetical protein
MLDGRECRFHAFSIRNKLLAGFGAVIAVWRSSA